jgi:AcrR family transcriptional regulator
MSSPEAARPGARPDARTALCQARAKFMRGERLDMRQLAAELNVDRSTLFRWVGNRDQLHVAILLSLADPTLRDIAAAAEGAGGARIAWIAGRYAEVLIETSYYRAFLRRGAERALRLITTKASPIQQHVVETFEGYVRREADRGSLTHPMRVHDLAYLIVRIIESFIYADLITGDVPDARNVRIAIAALLHADLESAASSR